MRKKKTRTVRERRGKRKLDGQARQGRGKGRQTDWAKKMRGIQGRGKRISKGEG